LAVGLTGAARAQSVPFPAVTTTKTEPAVPLTIPDPPAPISAPAGVASGTWIWGPAVPSIATVGFDALNPQAGRIVDVILGASTSYNSINATALRGDATHAGQLVANTVDTLKASGAGLTASGVGGFNVYCSSTPCEASQGFVNYNDSTNSVATPYVYSPTLSYNGDATQFVKDNQALYGAQVVKLQMNSVLQNQLGSISSYSVTGNYSVSLGRVYVSWTTDDVVRGTILPGEKTGQLINKGQILVQPSPQLSFTAQQAAALSGFTNFNYLQEYTSSGSMNWPMAGGKPTITSINQTAGSPLFPSMPASDGRVIGATDPLVGGNYNRPADPFDLYWDQTVVPGGPANNTVFDKIPNFGLTFADRPDLTNVGDFITFQTELVGVNMYNDPGGSTTVTYSPLTSSADGSLDETTIFNWMWVQTKPGSAACRSGSTDCGDSYFVTAGSPDSSGDDGAAFFLGFGLMDQSELDAAIQLTLAGLPSYDSEIFGSAGSTVPEPSTWAMMLVGAAGLGLFGRWRRGSSREKGTTPI